ncbi:hypothetical protein [Methanobrevibacter sp.]|uniref:hypothetical protein n=1 Tax=Methanobrevibacter sp. TaxID=66852 RepID=UPI00386F648B
MVAQKIDQCMKPHGEEGIETIKRMNEDHKNITEFAFGCINIGKDYRILDIGWAVESTLKNSLKRLKIMWMDWIIRKCPSANQPKEIRMLLKREDVH